ncbi:hypothetical protein BU14_0223s0020 [Porphyra umbilicalis]|uniref:Uncharacterized protein n=1 Tax=Porphyra umbilicalis TaxID=2786 RepID=A0A1X6P4G7_PORUM|nr:hypothetical protein BU14_0223s0020 [Porphyra umbilicalis]|eukprot:OSX75747.1 hypothetical protein BU14_0223s0020 [Porphyra umbilicalis]
MIIATECGVQSWKSPAVMASGGQETLLSASLATSPAMDKPANSGWRDASGPRREMDARSSVTPAARPGRPRRETAIVTAASRDRRSWLTALGVTSHSWQAGQGRASPSPVSAASHASVATSRTAAAPSASAVAAPTTGVVTPRTSVVTTELVPFGGAPGAPPPNVTTDGWAGSSGSTPPPRRGCTGGGGRPPPRPPPAGRGRPPPRHAEGREAHGARGAARHPTRGRAKRRRKRRARGGGPDQLAAVEGGAGGAARRVTKGWPGEDTGGGHHRQPRRAVVRARWCDPASVRERVGWAADRGCGQVRRAADGARSRAWVAAPAGAQVCKPASSALLSVGRRVPAPVCCPRCASPPSATPAPRPLVKRRA